MWQVIVGMWGVITGFLKKLLGGGPTLIGKRNQSVNLSSSGTNSPVLSAGRDLHLTMFGDGPRRPRRQAEELLEWIRKNAFSSPLSQVLSEVICLAQIVGNNDIEHWARLELFGYTRDGGMRQDEKVPEYRTIVGQYIDDHNRPLRLPAKLHFVNYYRARFGVATLEEFAKKTEMQNISDPGFIQLIREELGADVSRFCFNPVAVVEVVHAIRNQIVDKVDELQKSNASLFTQPSA